jgi:hypothetical protein
MLVINHNLELSTAKQRLSNQDFVETDWYESAAPRLQSVDQPEAKDMTRRQNRTEGNSIV